jgi:hypothetical protein
VFANFLPSLFDDAAHRLPSSGPLPTLPPLVALPSRHYTAPSLDRDDRPEHEAEKTQQAHQAPSVGDANVSSRRAGAGMDFPWHIETIPG